MITTKVDAVITVDKSSERFHRRYRETITDRSSQAVVERWLVDERCQTDQSGDFGERPQFTRADRGDGLPLGVDEDRVCKNCWPTFEDDTV